MTSAEVGQPPSNEPEELHDTHPLGEDPTHKVGSSSLP